MPLNEQISDLASGIANHLRDNVHPRLAPVWGTDANVTHTLSVSDLATRGVSMVSDGYNYVVVPSYADVPLPPNSQIWIEMGGEGRTRISPAPGVQVNVDPRFARLLAARYCTALLTNRGTNIWHLTGQLTAVADVPAALINSFTSEDSTIEQGESTTLTWVSSGGVTATISPGVGPVATSGSISVSPTQPTTYTLSITNEAGSVTQTLTVGVTLPNQGPPPAITSFTSNGTSVFPGNSVRFDWTTDNADSVTITPGPGAVDLDGFVFIVPEETTTYTITATNAYGTDTRQMTIGYGEEPPPPSWPTINSFTASPLTVQAGDNVLLEWAVTGADSVSINNGVGAVSSVGSATVNPTVDTTYTLSATNASGTGTATVDVDVAASGAGGEIAGDIVNSGGAVVQSAYVDMAQNFADPDKGIPYRLGPPATKTGVPTLTLRDDIGSISYPSSHTIHFQYGAENNVLINDFVTSNGAVLYAPSNLTAVARAVARYCTYQIDRHTVMQRPQLMWQSPVLAPPQVDDYVSQAILSSTEAADRPVVQFRCQLPADGGADKMSLVATQGSLTRGSRVYALGTETAQQRGSCVLAPGKVPTSIAIMTGGEYAFVTLWDYVNFKGQVAIIALGGVPMHRSWQDDTNWYDWWHEWMDGCKPGLKNRGGWAFMKVIGYLDLPSNMKAPTCSYAYTGLHPFESVYHDDGLGNEDSLSISGMNKEASPLEDNRARLLDYDDFGKYVVKGGLLKVGSKSEKTVCFIDLAPLITYTNSMYLNSAASNLETQLYMLHGAGAPAAGLGSNGRKYLNDANGDVYKKTAGEWAIIGNIGAGRGLGMAANQWPYMLADHPTAMPTIIKTVTMPGRVMGIRAPIAYNYWSKDNVRRIPDGSYPFFMADPHHPRSWIITDENSGTCHIFAVGRWVPGSKPPDQAPNANEIVEIGTPITGIGEQIVCVGSVKDYDVDLQGVDYWEDTGPGCLDEMLAVLDRKNRRINWIQFTVTSGDGGSIVGFLEDSRMDGTSFDHVDAYYRSNKIVMVSDWTGECVRNYRARTPVAFHYDGTSYPTLDVGGEYCGSLSLPGKPFSAVTSNSP